MRVLLIVAVFMNLGNCSSIHDQVLSITVSTQEQADVVKNISSQYQTVLWQPASPLYIKADSEVHLFVPANSSGTVQDILQRHHVTHEVLLSNTEELIQMQTKNDSTDPRSIWSYYEKYHSLEDIYHWINKTTMEHPDMVKAILIGSSFEKRPLYVIKLSGEEKDKKKAMWIDCGIHAREWISPAFCLWFVQHVLDYYQQNQDITQMLNTLDIYILPVMNPDGYKYTWTTNRMWRKNRSSNKESFCIGTDLNRNFDANWCTEGASSRPCDETYCGQFPESEPETQAVANFLRSHKESVKLYFSIHSYSQLLLFPYSCSYDQAQNHDELLELTREAAVKIKRYYRNNYRYGSGAKTIYLAPGGSDDWVHKLGISYAFTFELQDRGRYGFLLPPSLISKACNEALLAMKSITNGVMKKIQ